MQFAVKEVVTLMLIATLAYLILTHYTGFSSSVTAIGSQISGVEKTLQGR